MNIFPGSPPNILYKFLPPSLPNGKIPYWETDDSLRFSQPGSLNDLYECSPSLVNLDLENYWVHLPRKRFESDPSLWEKPPFSKIKAQDRAKYLNQIATERLAEVHANPGPIRQEILQALRQRGDQNLGILSLSEEWNIPSMWAHYASNNTGFLLGFEASHCFFRQAPLAFYKVDYQDERPEIRNSEPTNEEILRSIITKGRAWEHEKEWRLLAMAELKRLPLLSDSKPGGYEVRGWKIHRGLLKCVVFGVHIDPQIRAKIFGLCGEDVPLYQANLSIDSYKLSRIPV